MTDVYKRKGKDPEAIPAVLVNSHGPFAWGTDAENAVHNAVVLEEVAFMNFHALQLSPNRGAMQQELLDKHLSLIHIFRILLNVIVPSIKSAMIVVAMFLFIQIWNDLLQQMIYINTEDKFTISMRCV